MLGFAEDLALILKNKTRLNWFCNIPFVYVFVNIGMVTGLLPVVGVPLPFISYGGSSMLAVMFGFGLLTNCYINYNTTLTKGSFI